MNVLDAITRMVPALLVVLALPLTVWWWARRGGRTPGHAALRVGAKASFGRNLWVAIVEADDRRFLVGVAEHGINVIAELAPDRPTDLGSDTDAPDPANATPRPGMGLVRRLQHMTVRKPVRDPWRPRVPLA